MTIWAVVLLAMLEVKHFLFDFVFQTPYQLKHKGIYGHPGGLLHAGLHVLGTTVALAVVGAPIVLAVGVLVAEFVLHYHLDWMKEYEDRRRNANIDDASFWRMIGFDQLMHQLTYVAILAVIFI